MKFVVDRNSLSVAVGKIQGVISQYETVPVLKAYHLIVRGKELRIAATDMDLGVTVSVDLTGDIEEGEVVLSASKLNDIVSAVSGESAISLVVKDGVIALSSGRTKWRIKGMESADFPAMPSFEGGGQVLHLKRLELLAILQRVKGALAFEGDMRVNMKAVAVTQKRIMATDGELLAVQAHDFTCGSVEQIPGACVNDLVQVLKLSGVEDVDLVQGEDMLFIEVGEDIFFTRLLEGWAFPDVTGLFESANADKGKGVLIPRQAMIDAVRRVKVVSDRDRQEIQLTFKGASLELRASTADGDYAQETLPFFGEESGLCIINWMKLLATFAGMSSEKVRMKVLESFILLSDKATYLSYIIMRRDVG